MARSEIKLYYKNVTDEVLGSEHGITDTQLKDLAQKTSPLISKLNKERKAVRMFYVPGGKFWLKQGS